MGFDMLLGNDRLKENLRQSLAKGHISHFYLISGPQGSGKHTLAQALVAAILCRGGDRPCGIAKPIFSPLYPFKYNTNLSESKTKNESFLKSA